MPPDNNFRNPELTPQIAHFVLEQFTQRFHQLHVHAFGQATNVMMGLDGNRRATRKAHALDHIGVECALSKELRAAEFGRFFLEHFHKQTADGLALDFRVCHAVERAQEDVRRIPVNKLDVELATEGFDNVIRLPARSMP